MKRLTQRFRRKKQNRINGRKKFGARIENLEQRRMMFGDLTVVQDHIGDLVGMPGGGGGDADSPRCIDFEDLPAVASYAVGDSFVADNAGLQATFTGRPFEWSNGVVFAGGSANVSNGNLAAVAGQEIGTNNILLDVDFGHPVEDLSMNFGEYGGNLNVYINGDFVNFENFADINGAVIGGTNVSVTNGLGNDAGVVEIDGVVNNFGFGGQELWVDHICAQPSHQEEYRLDWGDAPDRPYRTLAAHAGAHHRIEDRVFLGHSVDGEADGQPTMASDGDDFGLSDDEDGVTYLTPLIPGQMAEVEVVASVDGRLNAWIDFDQSGTWDAGAENVFSNQPLVAGANVLSFLVPANAVAGERTYSRWRFSTTHGHLDPWQVTGDEIPNGEVEDHLTPIEHGQPDPRMDWGDAPDQPYPTLAVNGGARHIVNPDVFLGTTIDVELDGQPNAASTGDDAMTVDDEDGVKLLTPLVPGMPAEVEVTASTDGWLNAWIDMDQNGTWTVGEQVFTAELLAPGANVLSFMVPNTATVGPRAFSRWRFSTTHKELTPKHDPALHTPDGEVEDHLMRIVEGEPDARLDWGDAPDPPYPTLAASAGARHLINPDVFLGMTVDAEPNGQPHGAAAGDDATTVDDEDGVKLLTPLVPGMPADVEVTASTEGWLNAWIDMDQNGTWSAAEQIFTAELLAPGANVLSFMVPNNAKVGERAFSRWRFSTTHKELTPDHDPDIRIPNGEVEDHLMRIVEGEPRPRLDWGDAPDQPYPTLATNLGARHEIEPDVYLGRIVDAEADGQPSVNSLRDDANGGIDDEDGVRFLTPIVPGETATVEVIASVDGWLNAWIDFDRDGVWSGGAENVFSGHPLLAGINNLSFNVPAATIPAPNEATYSRWRFSTTDQVLEPFQIPDYAPNGEVEDHLAFIHPPERRELDFGDAPDRPYPTWMANNGARHEINPDVYLGRTVDGEPDGQPSGAAQRDDANGIIDDEDGVRFLTPLVPGQIAQVEVIASVDGWLNAWVDFDRDGNWNAGNENIFSAQNVLAGINVLNFQVPVTAEPAPNATYSRWRFSTTHNFLTPDQHADDTPDGEVEDHLAIIDRPVDVDWDFGDADQPYPTLLADDGARHAVDPNVFMGGRIDREPNGQPSFMALRDDFANIDDEDGVFFMNPIVPDTDLQIDVLVSVDGHIDAWIDFDQDGVWQPSEQIAASEFVVAGMNTINVVVPGDAISDPLRPVYSRFRFSLGGGLAPHGAAPEGEVEDYAHLNGDINEDGTIDATDIDLLCDLLHNGSSDGDLNNDGAVDSNDMDYLVQDILGTNYGDANLDGLVNSDDLVHMFIAGEYLDGIEDNSGWSEGDFDCDKDFTTLDLVKMFATGAYMPAPATSANLLAEVRSAVDDNVAESDDLVTDPAPADEAADQGPRRELLALVADSVFSEEPAASGDASPIGEEALDEFFAHV